MLADDEPRSSFGKIVVVGYVYVFLDGYVQSVKRGEEMGGHDCDDL